MISYHSMQSISSNATNVNPTHLKTIELVRNPNVNATALCGILICLGMGFWNGLPERVLHCRPVSSQPILRHGCVDGFVPPQTLLRPAKLPVVTAGRVCVQRIGCVLFRITVKLGFCLRLMHPANVVILQDHKSKGLVAHRSEGAVVEVRRLIFPSRLGTNDRREMFHHEIPNRGISGVFQH